VNKAVEHEFAELVVVHANTVPSFESSVSKNIRSALVLVSGITGTTILASEAMEF